MAGFDWTVHRSVHVNTGSLSCLTWCNSLVTLADVGLIPAAQEGLRVGQT